MKILLIDDDPHFREPWAEQLGASGFDVTLAEDGESGVKCAFEERFDAIIVDLMMPGVHGYEVIQQLRKSDVTSRIPIVAHSVKVYESDRKKALDLGADLFVAKSADPTEMKQELTTLITSPCVRFWGVRGSIATPGPDTIRYGGNTPCVTVDYNHSTLVLDAGTGVRKLGLVLQAEARGEPIDVNMLITHTHWDHIQGFPFFVPAYVPRNRIQVFGPRNTEKPLDRVLKGQMDPEYFPVGLGDMAADVTVIDVTRSPFQLDEYGIVFDYVNHPGVTLGYRIEVAGRVVTYVPDTEAFRSLMAHMHDDPKSAEALAKQFDQRLVDLAKDADLFIGDSQYTPSGYEKKVGWGHSNCLDMVDVAIEAGVKRFAPFSHDPMHHDDVVDEKMEMCQEQIHDQQSNVKLISAVEGHSVRLTP